MSKNGVVVKSSIFPTGMSTGMKLLKKKRLEVM